MKFLPASILAILITGILCLNMTPIATPNPMLKAKKNVILTIKSDESRFAKQFFAGFSSSTPEKITAFEYHGDNSRILSQKVKEINPDLVLTIGELPIFTSVSDFPTVPFLVSNFQTAGLQNKNNVILINHAISNAQKISMLKLFFPKMKTIGTIYDAIYSKQTFDAFAKEASAQNLKVLSIKASSDKEAQRNIKGFQGKIDAYFYISDNTLGQPHVARTIFDFLNKHNIPSLSSKSSHGELGALMTISPDPILLGEKASQHAHDILREGKIANQSISLEQSEYILSLSLSGTKQFAISQKDLFALTEQAAVDKGWKVLWNK